MYALFPFSFFYFNTFELNLFSLKCRLPFRQLIFTSKYLKSSLFCPFSKPNSYFDGLTLIQPEVPWTANIVKVCSGQTTLAVTRTIKSRKPRSQIKYYVIQDVHLTNHSASNFLLNYALHCGKTESKCVTGGFSVVSWRFWWIVWVEEGQQLFPP